MVKQSNSHFNIMGDVFAFSCAVTLVSHDGGTAKAHGGAYSLIPPFYS